MLYCERGKAKISIVDDVWEIWNKVFFTGITKNEIHYRLEIELLDLAEKYNELGVLEYPVNQFYKDGLIDVVWVEPFNHPVTAFEIDLSKKEKSIFKLLKIDVKERYWLYYGVYADIKSFISHLDPEHLITVIDLPYYKNKYREHIPNQ